MIRATPSGLELGIQDVLRFCSAGTAPLLRSGQAVAQDFPTTPITILVGVAPGGTLDALARLIGNSLSKTLKQPVVVENTTGAGGLIGMQRLLKSEPDGYTLMFSNLSMSIIPPLHTDAAVESGRATGRARVCTIV